MASVILANVIIVTSLIVIYVKYYLWKMYHGKFNYKFTHVIMANRTQPSCTFTQRNVLKYQIESNILIIFLFKQIWNMSFFPK